jgi:hypothetical protein
VNFIIGSAKTPPIRLLITTALDALIGWAALKRLKPKQD